MYMLYLVLKSLEHFNQRCLNNYLSSWRKSEIKTFIKKTEIKTFISTSNSNRNFGVVTYGKNFSKDTSRNAVKLSKTLQQIVN